MDKDEKWYCLDCQTIVCDEDLDNHKKNNSNGLIRIRIIEEEKSKKC